MRARFGAVSFAAVTVTLRALVRIDLLRGFQVGFGRSQRILQALVFRRDDPGFVFLGYPVNEQNANEKQERGKEKLAKPERAERVGHRNGKNSRTTTSVAKENIVPNISNGISARAQR